MLAGKLLVFPPTIALPWMVAPGKAVCSADNVAPRAFTFRPYAPFGTILFVKTNPVWVPSTKPRV